MVFMVVPQKTQKFIDEIKNDSTVDIKFTTEFSYFYINDVKKALVWFNI